jgi:hypothetical protein
MYCTVVIPNTLRGYRQINEAINILAVTLNYRK